MTAVRRFGLALVLLTAVSGVASATNPGGNLYSNFTTFSNRGPGSFATFDRYGVPFVPTTSGTVTSVTIVAQAWGLNAPTEPFSLQLRTDIAGSPGTLLALGGGTGPASNGTVTVNLPGSATVIAGTTYWIVFYDASNGGVSWNNADDTIVTLRHSTNSGATWGNYNDRRPALKVTGTALSPPVIVLQPTGQTLQVGDILSLSVLAAGATSYQWRLGGVAITGATGATYAKTATAVDAGSYDVVVTSAGGSVTSNAAVVTVSSGSASISTQPTGQTVFVGQTLTLSVGASGAISYLWRLGGVATAFTTATLSKTATIADAGSYDVVVTGADNNPVTSTAVTVVVNGAPSIGTSPVGQTLFATQTLDLSVAASGASLTYQWYKDGVIIAGAGSASFSKANLTLADAGSYSVIVTNPAGTATAAAAVVVNGTASIVDPVVGQTLFAGQTLSLSVSASGAGATFQWFHDGVAITGATSASYSRANVTSDDAGSYSVTISNPAGQATSTASVVVNGQPSITSSLAGQTLFATQTLELSVTATGAGLSYQWSHDGTPIAGATSASFSKASLTTGDAGVYAVVVSNLAGSATLSATIVINGPPSVTAPLADLSLFATQTLDLSVGSTGAAVSYQWSKDGYPIAGATAASFSKSNLGPGDAGLYSVTITNAAGQVSSQATLVVNTAPVIGSAPIGVTLFATQTLDLAVTASGVGVSYQWSHDGTPIAGAVSATLHKGGVTTADAGSYAVVVSNPAGSASASASVVINAAPLIVTAPVGVTLFATQPLSLSVVATGTGLSYQWSRDGSPIAGATQATYSTTATLADAGSYLVAVSNLAGTAVNSQAPAVVVVHGPPTVIGSPASQAVFATQTLSLGVAAVGSSMSFQWRKDGSPIGGATGPMFVQTGMSAGDAGDYDCVVSNPAGSATSNAAAVSVNPPPSITRQPVGMTVWNNQPVLISVEGFGAGLTYQWRKDGVAVSGSNGPELPFRAMTADAGSYDVVVSNPAGSVTSNAVDLVVHAAPSITRSPERQSLFTGQTLDLAVVADGLALTYQWRKDGVAIAGEDGASFRKMNVGAADLGSYDVVVSNPGGQRISAAAAVSIDGAPALGGQLIDQAVFLGQPFTFTMVASGDDLSFQWRKNGAPIAGETGTTLSRLAASADDAGAYDVVVSNPGGSLTSPPAMLTVAGAPTIASQPSDQSVFLGQPIKLAIVARGEGLTYQWRKDGTNIDGATAAVFDDPSAAFGDAGRYDVLISNPAGSLFSDAATVTLNGSPLITVQPVGTTLFATQALELHVVASGAGTSYQWRKDGVEIAGATAASFQKTAGADDGGSYDVVVTNGSGRELSQPAIIIVSGAPVIILEPASQTVFSGQTVTLQGAASGERVTYQWRKDGVWIDGATDSQLMMRVSQLDSGRYDLVATNPAGSVASAAAALSVDGAPVIASQSGSQLLNEGDMLSLSVTALGAGLSYRWFKDGAQLDGAAGPSFEKRNVTLADLGTYQVAVSNDAGVVTGDPIDVRVVAAGTGPTDGGTGPSDGGHGPVSPDITPIDQHVGQHPGAPTGEVIVPPADDTLGSVATTGTLVTHSVGSPDGTVHTTANGAGGCQAGGSANGSGFILIGLALVLSVRRRKR